MVHEFVHLHLPSRSDRTAENGQNLVIRPIFEVHLVGIEFANNLRRDIERNYLAALAIVEILVAVMEQIVDYLAFESIGAAADGGIAYLLVGIRGGGDTLLLLAIA